MVEPTRPGALYYKPRRYCDHARTLRGVLTGAVALAAGSAAYVYFMPRQIDVLLRIGAVIAAAIATGIICAVVIHYGRISSRLLGGALGLFLGLLTLYFMWGFWIQKTLGRWDMRLDLFRLFLHPLVIMDMIRALHDTVFYEVGDYRIDGGSLWLVWGLQGLTTVGSALGFGILGIYDAKPVCTECGSECPSFPRVLRFSDDERDNVAAAVNQRDFASLSGFSKPASDRDPELTIRIASCPLCGRMNVLTLSRLTWVTNKQGFRTLKTQRLIDGLLITSDETKAIIALMPEPPQADPDEVPANDNQASTEEST